MVQAEVPKDVSHAGQHGARAAARADRADAARMRVDQAARRPASRARGRDRRRLRASGRLPSGVPPGSISVPIRLKPLVGRARRGRPAGKRPRPSAAHARDRSTCRRPCRSERARLAGAAPGEEIGRGRRTATPQANVRGGASRPARAASASPSPARWRHRHNAARARSLALMRLACSVARWSIQTMTLRSGSSGRADRRSARRRAQHAPASRSRRSRCPRRSSGARCPPLPRRSRTQAQSAPRYRRSTAPRCRPPRCQSRMSALAGASSTPAASNTPAPRRCRCPDVDRRRNASAMRRER